MTASAFLRPALTPVAFLQRSAKVHGSRVAVLSGEGVMTYDQLAHRVARLAAAINDAGIAPGDRVSILATNGPLALEAHFAVPMAGAVLNMLNTRLSIDELGYIVRHAGSKLLLVDPELAETAKGLAELRPDLHVVHAGAGSEYEQLIAAAKPIEPIDIDEDDLLALNYTSGTTGRPKGVMYTHRGAYLQALAMVAHTGLKPGDRYLWTLPMFHCNGWCFPWAVTAAGATHVELRKFEPERVWDLLARHGITHFAAAPTVLTMLSESGAAARLPQPVEVMTGGAPPSPTLIAALDELGFSVTHLYGLTEVYGPAVVCERQDFWDANDGEDRPRLMARQGIANIVSRPVRVIDLGGHDVPWDGRTTGEVVLTGNNVMAGYYRDEEETLRVSFEGGFRTGDVGVIHPDGYLELRDRIKDVIISGGENIASIEVEQVICAHPGVLECAVVGASDKKWGEVPIAFVTLKEGASVDADEIRAWVGSRLARFKTPAVVYFGDLPKTSTGKIQKFVLRESVRES